MKTRDVLIILLALMFGFYIFTKINNNKNKGKIEVYKDRLKEIQYQKQKAIQQRDSVYDLYKITSKKFDSLYSIAKKDSIIYIYRQKKLDEKISNINNMSSNDKYSFFSER